MIDSFKSYLGLNVYIVRKLEINIRDHKNALRAIEIMNSNKRKI